MGHLLLGFTDLRGDRTPGLGQAPIAADMADPADPASRQHRAGHLQLTGQQQRLGQGLVHREPHLHVGRGDRLTMVQGERGADRLDPDLLECADQMGERPVRRRGDLRPGEVTRGDHRSGRLRCLRHLAPPPRLGGDVAQAPEVPTAVVSKRDFPMYEMNSLMDGTFSHLISALEEVGIQPIGPAFALHHRQPVSTADVEVGFPVDKPLTETLLLPSELEVTGSVLPAGRVGWISHIGGYGGLAEAWGAFTAEIGDSEEQMTHPFWEFYVTPPVPGVNPATLRTDLFSMLEPRDV